MSELDCNSAICAQSIKYSTRFRRTLRKISTRVVIARITRRRPAARSTASPTTSGATIGGSAAGGAAPRSPSADLRSLPLAAVVAGQPRRDPKPESLKPQVALQHPAARLSAPASRRRRHNDLFARAYTDAMACRPPMGIMKSGVAPESRLSITAGFPFSSSNNSWLAAIRKSRGVGRVRAGLRAAPRGRVLRRVAA